MVKLGEWVRNKRRMKGWAQVDLAKAAEVTIDTISRVELGKTTPELRTMRKIAVALGAEFAEVQSAFELGMKTSLEIQKKVAEFDRSVEPYSEITSHDIPLFELSVAAGPWTDVSDVAEVHQPGQIDHGFFRIRLAGDSMKPTYQDGQVVEFRCMRADREGPIEGKDYYVQRADGTATFKRVVKLNEDTMTLAALNKRKYPQAIIVERGLVVRMAVAIAKVELL